MKITGFADEIAADAGEQITGLQAAGVRYVEIRGVDGTNVLDLTDEQVDRFRAQLGDAGIGVSCIGSPIGKIQIRDDLQAHFARFEIALQRAAQFGCEFVRLFSFYHKDEEPAAVRDIVLEQFRRMADAAGQAGLLLVHENEKGIYGDTPERCADLLNTVDHRHLKAAFDPANFVQCGCSPKAGWPLLADRVAYFHIKDAVRETGRVVPAGLGDGDLEYVLQQAIDAGFDGFVSIEPHLKADDPDYGGDGSTRFSTATRALRDLLHRLGVRPD